jgi:hypothetical protein
LATPVDISTGVDNLSGISRMKLRAKSLADLLTHVANESITKGRFTNAMKIAKVVPSIKIRSSKQTVAIIAQYQFYHSYLRL